MRQNPPGELLARNGDPPVRPKNQRGDQAPGPPLRKRKKQRSSRLSPVEDPAAQTHSREPSRRGPPGQPLADGFSASICQPSVTLPPDEPLPGRPGEASAPSRKS